VITSTRINAATDIEALAMAFYVTGVVKVPTGFEWWSIDEPIASGYWSDFLWWLIHEAINENPTGALPHAIYAMAAAALGTLSGVYQGTTQSDIDYFKAALIAIAGSSS
jgi:hypothetical protein